MNDKLQAMEYALLQSVRLPVLTEISETDKSISELCSNGIYTLIECPDHEVYNKAHFACYINDEPNILSGQPEQKLRDINLSINADMLLTSTYSSARFKWVFTSGELAGQVFDLTDATTGKSNIIVGAAMHRILHLLNKSTTQCVWVNGDQRGKFKDFNGTLKLLLLDCYVENGFPHKGIAYITEVTVNFSKLTISGNSKGSVSIECQEPELSLTEIISQMRQKTKDNSKGHRHNRQIDDPSL